MSFLEKIYYFFFFLFKPEYWTMSDYFSKEWDTKLNHLMKLNKFKLIDDYEAELGGVSIWIQNHPYSSFTPYRSGRLRLNVRPSRMTVFKARQKFLTECMETL